MSLYSYNSFLSSDTNMGLGSNDLRGLLLDGNPELCLDSGENELVQQLIGKLLLVLLYMC